MPNQTQSEREKRGRNGAGITIHPGHKPKVEKYDGRTQSKAAQSSGAEANLGGLIFGHLAVERVTQIRQVVVGRELRNALAQRSTALGVVCAGMDCGTRECVLWAVLYCVYMVLVG
jgi:hypothetical protein